jgi:peptide/nickel transport system substrate-binding protein
MTPTPRTRLGAHANGAMIFPTMAELPRGTVTFLFTDIEGSTRLLKQLGERYGEVLAGHRRFLREVFERHGGEEIDTQGDAFFVAFHRAKDAVAAASAAQRSLHEHDWPDGAAVRVRMGMHTAEPSLWEEGYHGLGVHRAARICAAGHGGQVLLSQATHAVLEDELSGLELRDLGAHRLKDLDRPERIYQLVVPDVPQEFPPLKALERQPDEATPFEGRESELAEAAHAAVAPRPWYRARVGALALGGAVVAALIAGGILLFSGSSQALDRIEGDSAGLIDAGSNEIRKQVAVGSTPGPIAAGAGAVWVGAGDGTLSRIDPKANLVTQTISLDGHPSGIAVGGDAVWVASSEDRSLRKISPESARPGAPIRVGNGPSGVAVGHGAVWVANRLDDTISKVPLGRGRTKTFRAGVTPSGVAVSPGAVWVSNEAVGTVSRVNPTTGALQVISVGNGPAGLAVADGDVWVANSLDDTVSRIDPAGNTVVATIPVGKGPSVVATGADSVWVTNQFGGSVSRIDPDSNRVNETIEVGESPGGIAFSGSGVWVSAREPLTAHRGGAVRFVAARDIDFVDPAAAYTSLAWGILTTTNDGLLTFKRVAGSEGGQLVPDLATAIPKPSNGGKTYTFQLRSGLRYSDGAPVRASDLRHGLERMLEIDKVPVTFYDGIVGAQACGEKRGKCSLRQGVVANDGAGTVTFNLTKPDPEFLYKLALPFAVAVPDRIPSRIAAKGSLVPATGPYLIAEYRPQQRVVLTRNPRFREWSAAAQPDGFPSRIEFDLTKSQDAQVTAVERNKADLMVGFIPPDRLGEVTTRYAERLHVNTSTQSFFMFLNNRVPPFDRVDVRRALNYAADRDELIRRFLGPLQLQPSCQILPPNFPGYRPYCPYTRNPSPRASGTWTGPDVDRAKRLIASSGTRGTKVTVWGFRDPSIGDDVRIARYFASLLRRLGYQTSVKIVSTGLGDYFDLVHDSRNRAQIGSYGWIADYPAPSAFINSLLSCESFVPASSKQSNPAEFCNPKIDGRIKQALELQVTDQAAANVRWAELDRALTDQAPLLSMSAAKAVGFVSKRVGNYQYNPQFGVLIDQVWVR